MWLLSISCLEAGDDVLKAASLSVISSLMDACGLPVSVERVDYLIQCVAAAVLLVLQTTDPHNTGADCDGGHGTNGIDSDRDKYLPQLSQCIREDLLAMLTKALTPPSQLEKIPANIITKIVNNKFYRMVVSVLLVPLEQKEVMGALSVTADSHHQTTSQSHSPLVQKEVMGALSATADSHHQTTSQSHSPLVQKEVMAALSVTADSHHQTTSQSHSPLVQKEVMGALSATADSHHQTTSQSHSPLVQKEVMGALSATADSHHQTTSQSHSPLVQKEVMGALSATADSHHQTTSQSHSHKRRFSETEPSALKVVNLSRWWKDALDMLSEAFCKWCDSGGGGGGGGSFFPDAWLTTATDSLFTVITMSKDISLVLHLLDLFWGLIWTCSIIEPGSSACHLAHTWLALATLPWMVTEVKLMDLKLVNARQFTHWSAKLKWNEDVRVKSKSIRVIAVLPGNVAPRWRCQVVRAALSEREAQVMPQIATCFPLMVQQVGSGSGQQLVGEAVGAVINSPDTATVRAAAHSFRQLLCATPPPHISQD
ncbi:hypothetical protein Pmani_036633 [Petrolisthes manimaculis]|uniref:Uncharacterized protein n=1 Tax=Petrolisthes manimaculis TaxID=1843537 RepID=A0AAE1NK25_9EUCA|nr:hypothetical protein Pmani_036633 [Petrolisthes manimaculis]